MGNVGKAVSGAASGASAGMSFGPIGAAVGGIAGALGGIFGGGDDGEEAAAQRAAALAELTGVQNPTVQDLQIALERYKSAGQLTPELEQFIGQESSRMEQVSTDPRLKQAQMQALGKLQQVGEQGLTPEDRLALSSVQRDVAREAQGRQQSILQNMSARGAGGSGAELAAQLSASQAGAERASQEGMNVSAQAQRRALDAIMKSGQLSGDIRNQDFSQQEAVARASDEISRFNAANRQAVAGANVNRGNRASEANLSAKQSLMDSNTGLGNQEQMHNKQLLVDDYNRKMAKAKAISDVRMSESRAAQDKSDRADDQFSGIAQGVAGAATTIGAKINDKGPAKYDTKTGDALYDPHTGKKAGSV